MYFFDHAPQRDYEEALRALGSILDEQGLEDALVLELAEGFMATGRRRRRGDDVSAPTYEHAETILRDEQLVAVTREARTQRGSGREAGRYAQALRLIGHRVSADRGSFVLVVDHGDGYMLRMRSTRLRNAPFQSTTIAVGELDRMRSKSIQGRMGPKAERIARR